ncbi:uncharacterized protein LOC121948811 [Plectropomus leopardus]|uniref:uncharacterized protein LOC121948811 n=1 Tax=Plectropomus leopardus TaxID=160734 RepID=UPI001C4B1212|nr:uncharacterized protein LOC121948811 [Plectropomus leopardus]
MSPVNLVIFLLCGPVIGQIPLLNATVGGSVLIGCSLPVHQLLIRWFYWQEDQSENILFHSDTNMTMQPIADRYTNRCEAFNTEFSSGNISVILHNVSVGDDQKTFWAYVGFYDVQKKVKKWPEQWCKSKLRVSAPYQDLVLTVSKATNNATCTAHGGYPEPQVSWTGVNRSSTAQLEGAELSLLQDPTKRTFNVTSSVSVKGLQSVTCLISNPDSNESIQSTTEIDAPGCTTRGASCFHESRVPTRKRSAGKAEEMPKHVKELYRARVTAFPQEMMRGNISVKLGKVTLEDDQRFFQAFATLVDRDGRSIRSDPYEPICQMTLHVAVSYQDVSLAVSEETMTAVCTAQRGFPKPLIEWRLQNPSDNSQHFLNPKDVNTSAVQDPQNHLYSLRSTIDIPAGRYRSVTCLIHNPTINVTLLATHLLNKGEAERSLPGWATALIAAAAVACFHLSSSHSYAAVA